MLNSSIGNDDDCIFSFINLSFNTPHYKKTCRVKGHNIPITEKVQLPWHNKLSSCCYCLRVLYKYISRDYLKMHFLHIFNYSTFLLLGIKVGFGTPPKSKIH